MVQKGALSTAEVCKALVLSQMKIRTLCMACHEPPLTTRVFQII